MTNLHVIFGIGIIVSVVSISIPFDRKLPPKKPMLLNLLNFSSQRSSSSSLASIYGIYYVGSVTVGSQSFQMMFDTGSSDVWIPGPTCGSACAPHPLYTGPYTSPPTTTPFSITYGDGSSVSGLMVYAYVSVGGSAYLDSFNVDLISSVTDLNYASAYFDGIFGMAFLTISSVSAQGFVPLLFQANKIPANLFTIYFPPNGDGGFLTIGEIIPQMYTGSIVYMPLISASYWTVYMRFVTVNGNPAITRPSTSSTWTAIIDSGTSLLLGPSSSIATIISQIQTATGVSVSYNSYYRLYTIPCSRVGLIPSVTFTMAGSDGIDRSFVIPSGSALVLESVSDGTTCPLGLGGLTSVVPSWILGDVFMRRFFSVFDYTNLRIGLAQAAQTYDPTASSISSPPTTTTTTTSPFVNSDNRSSAANSTNGIPRNSTTANYSPPQHILPINSIHFLPLLMVMHIFFDI